MVKGISITMSLFSFGVMCISLLILIHLSKKLKKLKTHCENNLEDLKGVNKSLKEDNELFKSKLDEEK